MPVQKSLETYWKHCVQSLAKYGWKPNDGKPYGTKTSENSKIL